MGEVFWRQAPLAANTLPPLLPSEVALPHLVAQTLVFLGAPTPAGANTRSKVAGKNDVSSLVWP